MSAFFFKGPATAQSYTLSLHDALPICHRPTRGGGRRGRGAGGGGRRPQGGPPGGARSRLGARDRKSTRLKSSHGYISYAVFCLKKKIDKSIKGTPGITG